MSGARRAGHAPGTILVDFDGTLTTRDVGHHLFEELTQGRARTVVDSWKRGEISSRECLIGECALARGTRDRVRDFARAQAVEPSFAPFVAAAGGAGWRVRVVSDGLDVYILALLGRHGLDHVPVEANRVRFVGDRLLPSFPYAGRGCGRCGNCKGGAVAAARVRGRVLFVGDGLSDRCAVGAADVVFAKGELARYCGERGAPCVGFSTFEDVWRHVETGIGSAA